MKISLLKCLRQAPTLSLAGLCCWFVAGGVTALLGPAPLLVHAAATDGGAQAGVSLPADAAFSTKLGVFVSGPPCDQHLASLNSPQWLWPGCAGPTTLPIPGTRAYGNPMAHPGLGIPLGGVGSGAFMLNQAGTFGPWDMGGSVNTNYEDRILPQAAFHVRVQSGNASPATRTLAVNNSQFGSVLPAWNSLPAGQGTYSALYPFGTIDYGQVAAGTNVSLKFWSPFVANNDELLSQPVAYFDLEVSNTSSQTANISTMLTFPNAPAHVVSKVHGLIPPAITSTRTGFYSKYDADPATKVHGVTLGASSPQNTPDSENSEWTEAVRVLDNQQVSYTTSWNADGSGEDVYAAFNRDGTLPNAPLDGSNSAGALAVSVTLAPHTSTVIHYALAWDFPQVGFGLDEGTVWMRRYTSFYGGREDDANNYVQGSYPFHQGFAIANKNLAREDASLQKVLSWWQPLATNSAISPEIRRLGLNEIYHLVWTGPFWESGLVKTNLKGSRIGAKIPDTHLYYMRTGGGWAGANEANVQGHGLLPLRDLTLDAEKGWVRAVSEQIATGNGGAPDKFGSLPGTPFFAAGGAGVTFVPFGSAAGRAGSPGGPGGPGGAGAPGGPGAPGAPGGGFGRQVGPGSAYFDLSPKYLIRAYGVIRADKTHSSLREFYPAMLRAYQKDIAPRIPADKGLPIEAAMMGSTYDMMGFKEGSLTIYNSGLYLLSLEIMISSTQEAKEFGIPEAQAVDVAQLKTLLAVAKAAYEKAFWTGTYYKEASEGLRYTDVFSDTLWPQHHAQLLGLPDLAPTDHIVSHLRTAGKLLLQNKDDSGHVRGMANSMPIDGTLHPFVGLPGATPNMDVWEVGFDSREVWMGANYALAATFIETGKRLGLADLTETGVTLAKALDYQVYSPSSPGKGAFVFNEPNAYYAGDPRITRGPGMSRNLSAWDILKAAAAPSPSGKSAGGRATGTPGR